jgi:hypothetical protein
VDDPDTKIARILTRAAQMQQGRDDEERLALVEEAAAEVGIDRALVRRAALEQSLDTTQVPQTLGVPTRVVRRRWIDADIADPQVRARLLARLDTVFGAQGQRTEEGRGATWSARHVVVTFEGEADGTLVQISERFVNTASSFMGVGATVGLAAGAMLWVTVLAALGKGLLAGVVATPLLIAAMAVGLQFGRSRTLRWIANAEAAFEQALQSLEQAASQPSLPPAEDD